MAKTTSCKVAGLVAAMVFAVAAKAPLTIATDAGKVQGLDQGNSLAFLGIPYAKPPTGRLRWREPRQSAHWVTVRHADRFGPNCPQPGATLPTSEDCLYLNVWTPKRHPAKPLPVMVWIHGGAYIVGSGNLPDTSAFTRDGIVLVSLNYRLGRLGFFAHPALSAEPDHGLLGNYGIMDQLAALRWVHANIRKFGGDPGNVTVFGVSAGATFVDMLMLSPLAKGLIHKAIAESDPFLHPWPYLSAMKHAGEPSAEDLGQKWAASLGLAQATPDQLRAVPADKLIAAPNEANVQGLKPLIDGTILPERGPEAYGAGLAKKIPYIMGGNSYEGSLTATYVTDPTKLIASLGTNAGAVLRAYGPAITGNPSLLTGALSGDIAFVAPRRVAVRLAAAHGTPTWSYHFAYVPESLRSKLPGAPHGSEVPFVYDSLTLTPRADIKPTAADWQMAHLVHRYWVNFAKYGNPNGTGRSADLPVWPRASATHQPMLVFGNDGVTVADPFEANRLDPIEASLVKGRSIP